MCKIIIYTCCALHKIFNFFDFSPDFKRFSSIKTISVYSAIKILSIYAIWSLFGAQKLTWRLAHFRAQKKTEKKYDRFGGLASHLSYRLTVFCLEVRWLCVLCCVSWGVRVGALRARKKNSCFFFRSSRRRAVLTRTRHKSTSAEVSWTEFYLLPRGQRECRRSGRAILRTVCIQIVFVALKNNRRLAMIPLVSCLRSVNICDDCLTHLCKQRHC